MLEKDRSLGMQRMEVQETAFPALSWSLGTIEATYNCSYSVILWKTSLASDHLSGVMLILVHFC